MDYPDWFRPFLQKIQEMEHEIEYLKSQLQNSQRNKKLPYSDFRKWEWTYEFCSMESGLKFLESMKVERDLEVIKMIYFHSSLESSQYAIRWNSTYRCLEFWIDDEWKKDETENGCIEKIRKNLQKYYLKLLKDSGMEKDTTYFNYSQYIFQMDQITYRKKLQSVLLQFLQKNIVMI